MQLIDARLRVGSAPVKICIQTSSWKWSSSYSSLLSGLKKIKIYYTLLIFQIFDGGAAARNSSRNVILLLIHLEGCCGREGIFRASTWPFLSWWPLPHKSGQYYEGSISDNHMLSISVLSVFLGTGRKKKKRKTQGGFADALGPLWGWLWSLALDSGSWTSLPNGVCICELPKRWGLPFDFRWLMSFYLTSLGIFLHVQIQHSNGCPSILP